MDESTQSLSDSKDIAQAAATWAMSIVHLTLLNTLIQQTETGGLYKLSLFLVVSVITLQIIVGMLTLIVANKDTFFKRLHSKMSDEDGCNRVCCLAPCGEIRKKGYEIVNADYILKAYDSAKNKKDLFLIVADVKRAMHSQIHRTQDSERGCCICCTKLRTYPIHEENIQDLYSAWQVIKAKRDLAKPDYTIKLKELEDKEIANSRLRTEKAKSELKHLKSEIAKVKRNMESGD